MEKVFFHVILNAYWQPLEFELPQPGSRGAGPLAAVDRYSPRFTAGYRRMEGGTINFVTIILGRVALCGSSFRERRRVRPVTRALGSLQL
jgi:hypothetical protein